MKVVLDTNVLLDSIHDLHSLTWKILELAWKGDVVFFASTKILKEYQLIIDRNIVSQDDQQNLQNFIGRVSLVAPRTKFGAVPADPEDDKFVDTAVEAGADYIISSDHHLLELVEFRGVKMVTPADFYHQYKSSQDSDGQKQWGETFSNLFK